MRKVVIVGAGRTGRGYIARQMPGASSSAHATGEAVALTFVDRNEELVERLALADSFEVRFGNGRETVRVAGFDSLPSYTEEATQALAEADLVLTAVGEQNLPDVAAQLLAARELRAAGTPLLVVTCENGVAPKRKLVEALPKEGFVLGEAIVFCTTDVSDGLDILSEDLDYIPYDIVATGKELGLPGFVPEERFHDLLERKIYTYNCLSACIAYLGALRGFDDYGQAAGSKEILSAMHELKSALSGALSARYGITFEEQDHFGDMAIGKFTNKDISDSIVRNARAVRRKLGPSERIVAPMRILMEQGQDARILQRIAAAAVIYGTRVEGEREEELLGLLRESLGADEHGRAAYAAVLEELEALKA